MEVSGRDVLQGGSSDDNSIDVLVVRMHSRNLCTTATVIRAKAAGFQVLGCVYDGFGRKHEAVKKMLVLCAEELSD